MSFLNVSSNEFYSKGVSPESGGLSPESEVVGPESTLVNPNLIPGAKSTVSVVCRRKRVLNLKNLNLQEKFSQKDVTVESFLEYCRLFGPRPAYSTIRDHKNKPWEKIPEHWQIKYLAFFHQLSLDNLS